MHRERRKKCVRGSGAAWRRGGLIIQRSTVQPVWMYQQSCSWSAALHLLSICSQSWKTQMSNVNLTGSFMRTHRWLCRAVQRCVQQEHLKVLLICTATAARLIIINIVITFSYSGGASLFRNDFIHTYSHTVLNMFGQELVRKTCLDPSTGKQVIASMLTGYGFVHKQGRVVNIVKNIFQGKYLKFPNFSLTIIKETQVEVEWRRWLFR